MSVEKTRPGRLVEILAKAEEKGGKVLPLSLGARIRALLRRRIITGALFLIPIAITVWVVSIVLDIIDPLVGPAVRQAMQWWKISPETTFTVFSLSVKMWLVVKVIGVLISIVVVMAFLYLVGFVTERTAARRLITLGERLVLRIPFVKFFYKTSKQIVDTLALTSKGAPKKVVIIDFPYPGIKVLAFATGETPLEGSPEKYVNVFVAKTPNPTSGFLLLLPMSQVWETDLTLEEGLKWVISGGILHPEQLAWRPYQAAPPQDVAEAEKSEYGDLKP